MDILNKILLYVTLGDDDDNVHFNNTQFDSFEWAYCVFEIP